MHGPAVQLPSGEYMYSRYKPKRQKRIAITAALGLAFSGINAYRWFGYQRNGHMEQLQEEQSDVQGNGRAHRKRQEVPQQNGQDGRRHGAHHTYHRHRLRTSQRRVQ